MTYKSYDQLLDEILTSYRNASPNTDASMGSELYIRAAGLASVVWGLQKLVLWTIDQMFPSSAEPDTLLRYGLELGLTKSDGESWEQFLGRILSIYRDTSGGGNKADVERWAMSAKVSVDGVDEMADSARCYPAKFGPGTVVIVVSKASGDPSQALLDRIRTVVLENGPVVPAEVYVLKPTTRPVSIAIAGTGGNRAQIEAAITNHIASLLPGQQLYPVVLQGICLQFGMQPTPVITPSEIQTPGPFERIVLAGAIAWL